FASTMAGMKGKALEAARRVSEKVSPEVAKEVYWLQGATVLPQLTLLSFGEWRRVLEEPLPPADLPAAAVLSRYAQGTALAALGDEARAKGVLAELEAGTAATEPDADPVGHIARH